MSSCKRLRYIHTHQQQHLVSLDLLYGIDANINLDRVRSVVIVIVCVCLRPALHSTNAVTISRYIHILHLCFFCFFHDNLLRLLLPTYIHQAMSEPTIFRTAPIQLYDLPTHPKLPATSDLLTHRRPRSDAFIKTILSEATAFLVDHSVAAFPDLNRDLDRGRGRKGEITAAQIRRAVACQVRDAERQPAGDVGTSRGKRRGKGKGKEKEKASWYLRKTVHADAAAKGTASWEEIKRGMMRWNEYEVESVPFVQKVTSIARWELRVESFCDWSHVSAQGEYSPIPTTQSNPLIIYADHSRPSSRPPPEQSLPHQTQIHLPLLRQTPLLPHASSMRRTHLA